MKMQSGSLIVLAAVAFGGVSVLAVAGGAEGRAPSRILSNLRSTDLGADEPCPPASCSIVFKTEKGGPPSTVVHVERAPAPTVPAAPNLGTIPAPRAIDPDVEERTA